MSLSELNQHLALTPGLLGETLPPDTPDDVMAYAIKVQLYQITARLNQLAPDFASNNVKEDNAIPQPPSTKVFSQSDLEGLAILEAYINDIIVEYPIQPDYYYNNRPADIKSYYYLGFTESGVHVDNAKPELYFKTPQYQVVLLSHQHLVTLKTLLERSYVANILIAASIYRNVYDWMPPSLQSFYIRDTTICTTKELGIDDLIYLHSLLQ